MELSNKLKGKTSKGFVWESILPFIVVALITWAMIAVFYQGEAQAQSGMSQYDRRSLEAEESQAESLKKIVTELRKIRLELEKQGKKR